MAGFRDRLWAWLRLVDDKPYAPMQRAYEYLLDRWRIRIGSFRISFVLVNFLITEGNVVSALDGSLADFGLFCVATACLAVAFWVLFLRDQLVENMRQDCGDLVTINGRALTYRRRGAVLRLVLIGIFIGYHAASRRFIVSDAVGLAFFCAFSYALGVFVREPDKARFKKNAKAPANAVPQPT